MTPVFLKRPLIEKLHGRQIERFGGAYGLRDENALESALSRPINKFAYGCDDIIELAAAYLYGIVRNHPYSDGNKRTGFLAAFTFLMINGYIIEAGQADVVEFVLGVAAGEIDEEGATRFLRDVSVPLSA